MEWTKQYAIGISVIDAQHKQLFRLSDEFDAALKAGVRSQDIDSLLDHIGEYVARHFAIEEKYMTELSYPGLAEQQEAHEKFVARFEKIHKDFKGRGMTQKIVEAVRRELTDWVRSHVTGIDQRFGEYYKNQ